MSRTPCAIPPQPHWFKPWSYYYSQALDHMAEIDRLGFHTPEDCVRHLRETFSASAPDELLISADLPGMLLEDTLEYLRVFAEKVLPQLQDLPLAK